MKSYITNQFAEQEFAIFRSKFVSSAVKLHPLFLVVLVLSIFYFAQNPSKFDTTPQRNQNKTTLPNKVRLCNRPQPPDIHHPPVETDR
jgi:hypothetical protein